MLAPSRGAQPRLRGERLVRVVIGAKPAIARREAGESEVKQFAPGIWRLKEFPAPTINCYLVEDVLIDAGRTWDRRRIMSEIEDRELSMLALTHVHPDHQGAAKDVCEARAIPLACHADDVDAMEGRRPVQEAAADNPVNRIIA